MEESKKFFLLKKVFVNGDSQQMVATIFFSDSPRAPRKILLIFLISLKVCNYKKTAFEMTMTAA